MTPNTRRNAIALLFGAALQLLSACGPKCQEGREASGKYCCWPGQTWSDAREACVGAPKCPSGLEVRAGGCMSPLPKCPEGMIGVGAASFHIGTNREGKEWQGSRPVREVKVKAFCLDRTEVTVAAYKKCVDAGQCKAPTYVLPGDDWVDKACNELTVERASYPVNCIDWARADAYCRWAQRRLPTEEEWQLAAGRMDGRRFAWGDAPPGPDKANLLGGDEGPDDPLYPQSDGYRYTAPVGSFAADQGPFGHLDVGGNVDEWSATEVENHMKVLLGGEYSGRDIRSPELRGKRAGKTSLAGPMNGVRCAKSSGP